MILPPYKVRPNHPVKAEWNKRRCFSIASQVRYR